MDPNANLAEQLTIANRLLKGSESPIDVVQDALRLAELVEALDGWIRHGGFLPQLWMAGRR